MGLTSDQCGITSNHIAEIQKLAKSKKCFIMCRPVNSF